SNGLPVLNGVVAEDQGAGVVDVAARVARSGVRRRGVAGGDGQPVDVHRRAGRGDVEDPDTAAAADSNRLGCDRIDVDAGVDGQLPLAEDDGLAAQAGELDVVGVARVGDLGGVGLGDAVAEVAGRARPATAAEGVRIGVDVDRVVDDRGSQPFFQ